MIAHKKHPASHSNASILKGFLILLRPMNAVMTAAGTYIGYSLVLHAFTFNLSILYGMLSVVCISGAGQAINDFFDYEIDKKKKNNRPLASGLISRKTGLVYSIALFFLGIMFASFMNEGAFLIAVIFSIILLAYSAFMPGIKFVGNIIVSLGVAFTYIFGASILQITPLVLMIALAGFFSNWTREIIKDVEDAEEDRGVKVTLPQLLSRPQVEIIIFGLLVLTVAAGYLPTFLAKAGSFYTVIVTMSNIVFIAAMKKVRMGHAGKAQSLMKRGMIVGLLAQLSLIL